MPCTEKDTGEEGWVAWRHGGVRDRSAMRGESVLSFAAIAAQLLYAAPDHLVCTISGYRQYLWVLAPSSSCASWASSAAPAAR
jgi:hypothetical protein